MRFIDSALVRLARAQVSKPIVFVAVGVLLAVSSLPLVLSLSLNGELTALLPRHTQSVKDLEAVGDRVGGQSTLTVAIESQNHDAAKRFARALAPRIEQLKTLRVRRVDFNVSAFESFVLDHRHLYADLDDLREIRDSLQDRWDYEHAKANPFFVDLQNDVPEGPDNLISRLEKKAESRKKELSRYPDGFFIHPQANLLAMFVRTEIEGGNVADIHKLVTAIEREAERLGPLSYAPDLKVEFGGALIDMREEHDAIERELVTATLITVVLCLVAILLFFFRFRAIPLLGISLVIPVILTFAVAKLSVDYLNASTAFLGSIVIGNGINPFIVWLARYFEERRKGQTAERALLETHRGAWTGTLVASVAAAIAYGSLILTDFRGFRDFGMIGGVGMILCWIATLLILPCLCLLADRAYPMRFKERAADGNVYGRTFARVVFGSPRLIVWISTALFVTSAIAMAIAIAGDPLEYDFRNLQSVRQEKSRATYINGKVNEIVDQSAAGNAIAMVAARRQDIPALRRELEKRQKSHRAPFGAVRSLDDLLPADQPEKIRVLSDIRELLVRMRPNLEAGERARVDEYMPPAKLRPVSDADLPSEAAQLFTERDGTRGRILFVEQDEARSNWDGKYLIEWSESLRSIELPGGAHVPLAGRAPVFADMLSVILTDGPKAVLLSLLATTALLFWAFRRKEYRLLALGSLLFGVVWMAGAMAILRMKLNFLNFVAFPITFGIGVDYAANVLRRSAQEADAGASTERAVRAAVEETGGAVILCSLTTIIGYASLHASSNLALNSFGIAMEISEVTCLLAAVLTVPSLMLLRARRKQRRDSARAAGTALPPLGTRRASAG